MNKAWMGKLITGVIVLGVAAILLLNLAPTRTSPGVKTVGRGDTGIGPTPADPKPLLGPVGEHPIGDEVIENHMRIAAVWLSAVAMEGMSSSAGPGQTPIHIEADVKATENNPQGFGKDHFVPYLRLTYKIVPAAGGPPIDQGDLGPMMAKDGFHYGATIAMPKPGDYRLIYEIEPGSVNHLGLHRDAATGVEPWWKPFTVSYDWTVDPETPSTTSTVVGTR